MVPTFAGMFLEMGAELPGPTQIVMDASNLIQDYALLWVVLIVAAIVAMRTVLKVPQLRLKFDTLLLKAPKIGDLLTQNSCGSFWSYARDSFKCRCFHY